MNEIITEDDSSPFSRFPEDVVLHILSKLMDLKTLCLCKLVSKRFLWIVSQVEAISFTFLTDPDPTNFGSSRSVIGSLMKFEKVKSVCIQLLSLFDDHSLFKWKFITETRLRSFVILSPKSVCHNKEVDVNENDLEEEEEDMALSRKKEDLLGECVKDVSMRVELLDYITRLPLLEKVSITDLSNRGKVSISRGKTDELVSSSDETIGQKQEDLHSPSLSKCYVHLLNCWSQGTHE